MKRKAEMTNCQSKQLPVKKNGEEKENKPYCLSEHEVQTLDSLAPHVREHAPEKE